MGMLPRLAITSPLKFDALKTGSIRAVVGVADAGVATARRNSSLRNNSSRLIVAFS
jgi:hypothetical protein